MIEALALKRALLIAIDLGYDKAIFETDCLMLKNCIEKKQPDLHEWQCRACIMEILDLMSSKARFSISFTLRSGNKAADHLAAEACKDVYPIGWVSQPTPPLTSILALDIIEGKDCPDASSPNSDEPSGVLLPSPPRIH